MALRQEEFTRLCDDVDLDRDRALVERCQAGDSAAFGNLYARYYERLLRFCLRRLNDRHEAEDAAQEAFARAWKALPTFAGERRFYPWLTVIAGNICTDTLRRRSRSTPTDDLELSAHQPLGSYGSETSEELVLAAVDGELVNKALDRLSVRHRHVLAMREGSGWTYQQIADHEGVEIGTIETLLWRARQALKREFSVLSESKGAMGGFLIGTGALLRRGVLRVANRAALLVPGGGGGGSGSFRNAFAGVAVTSAAVAAAIITPHAFSSSPKPADPVAASTQAAAAIADPPLPLAAAAPAPSAPSDAATSVAGTDGDSTTSPVISALRSTADGAGQALPKVQPTTDDSPAGPLTDDPSQTIPIAGGLIAPLTDPITAPLAPLTQVAAGVTDSVANTFDGLAGALGLGLTLPQLGGVLSPSGNSTTPGSTTTTTTPSLIGGVANTVTSTLKNLLGAS